jgi:hypothetical protein
MTEWKRDYSDFRDDWGVGGLGVCECEPEFIGRCWLQVDQSDWERNFDLLKRKGQLSVFAFAQEESARLGRKVHEMKLRKIDRLNRSDYCAAGGCFMSETEREKCVLEWLEGQA